jgi:hypothetical protein
LDKPTNALSWGRKPAAFTKLIDLTHRLFEAPGYHSGVQCAP